MDIYQKIRKVLMVSAIILSILEVLFFFSEGVALIPGIVRQSYSRYVHHAAPFMIRRARYVC